MYRQFIESAPAIFKTENGLVRETLEEKTLFKSWKVSNIVSHIRLPYRPDLQMLLEAAGGNANWQPGLFPGLKFLVWLRPKSECKCKKEKSKVSCACNVRALIFDTGKIIITGGTTMHDVNLAKHRLLSLLDDEEFQDSEEQVPRSQRFAKRREKFLQNPYIVFEGINKKGASKKRVRLEEEDSLVKEMTLGPTIKKSKDDESITPFMKACEKGKVKNVKMMLSETTIRETDDDGNTALDRLLKLGDEMTKNHLKIVEMLREFSL